MQHINLFCAHKALTIWKEDFVWKIFFYCYNESDKMFVKLPRAKEFIVKITISIQRTNMVQLRNIWQAQSEH